MWTIARYTIDIIVCMWASSPHDAHHIFHANLRRIISPTSNYLSRINDARKTWRGLQSSRAAAMNAREMWRQW